MKNGIAWREEQQGEYGRSGEDTPDYGPRGCQKGRAAREVHVWQAAGAVPDETARRARCEGRWERISWDQAAQRNCRSSFIDHAVADPDPNPSRFAMGTQMTLKRASFASLFRFCESSPGIMVPETFAGVGDLPVGAYHDAGLSNCPAITWRQSSSPRSASCGSVTRPPRVFPTRIFSGKRDTTARKSSPSRPISMPPRCTHPSWLNPRPGTDGGAGPGDGAGDYRRPARSTGITCVSRRTCLSWSARTIASSCGVSDMDATAGRRIRQGCILSSGTRPPTALCPGAGHRLRGNRRSRARTPGLKHESDPDDSVSCNRRVEGPLDGRDGEQGPVEVTTVFELTREMLQGLYTGARCRR